ncbi:Uncharacterized conserved protein, DUF1499 family [Loktanella sp. DSM 29012]|uniref:DUF1499 domain-containing protein n=1 Tax=Loktanella sp. DSM 29012 TaxID=1881056 RepID=UPI0008CA9190|nr:DUF1499 domain-containing protein [Loktanella sp. DSM 29012]SEQ25139.1 Uncharacterized conserved protein, DUF1499 family [Loktanella sp. DSM 29012]
MLKTAILAIVVVIFVAVLAFAAYVRLSPTDVARFHVAPAATEPTDMTGENSFTAARFITTAPQGMLQAFVTLSETRDDTTLVAGSVAENLLTFETRSRLMGYPDYTTVTVTDDAEPLLVIHAQSRFGKSDMGVNQARVREWLNLMGNLVVPLS